MPTFMMFRCPHCRAKAKIRTSRELSNTLREVFYQCADLECGFCFAVHAEAVRSLSPSAKPDPAVQLPYSTLHAGRLAMSQPEGGPCADLG